MGIDLHSGGLMQWFLKAGVWVCTKVLMIFMVEIFLEECEKISTPCFKDQLSLDLYKPTRQNSDSN